MKNNLLQTFWKYKYLIVTFVCVFLSAYWIRESVPSVHISNIIYATVNAILIVSLVILISKTKKAYPIFVLILTLLITTDITHMLMYSSQLTIGGIGSMFETNITEAGAFLSQSIVYVIFCFIFTFLILFFAVKEAYKHKTKTKYALIPLVLCILFLGYSLVNDRNMREKLKEEMEVSPFAAIQSNLVTRTPIGLSAMLSSAAYWNEMRIFRREINREKTLIEGLIQDSISLTPDKIFLIIGESSLRSHYSIYGYDIPTSPILDSLYRTQRIKVYDALTVAPFTREALRMTLTFASPLDKKPFFENENLISMANILGYQSYWISNQDNVSVHDSYMGLLASYAQHSVFYKYEKDDLDLLLDVKKHLKKGEKQIFFIHLKGNHLSYRDKRDQQDIDALTIYRGPADEDLFDYDCSIHHMDRLIGEVNTLIEKEIKGESSVMIYYSDHGEIIGKGHGFIRNDSIGKEQFKVPFIISQNNFAKKVDSITSQYVFKGILNTNSLPYIVSDILGYKVSPELYQKAKKEAMYYNHVDGKIYDIKNIQ